MMFPEINAWVIPGIVCNNRGAMYRSAGIVSDLSVVKMLEILLKS